MMSANAIMMVLIFLIRTVTWTRAQPYEDFTTSDRIPRIKDKLTLETVTNLPRGVVFKKTGVLDMSSSSWPHIFRIEHLPQLPPAPSYSICENIPVEKFGELAMKLAITNTSHPDPEDIKNGHAEAARIKLKIAHFCEKFTQLERNYAALAQQARHEVERQYTLMKDLILPNRKVDQDSRNVQPTQLVYSPRTYQTQMTPIETDEIKHRQKRGLFSFLGEATGHWFGLANTKDLKKLWSAIDTLQADTINFASQFNRFSDEMITISKLERERVDHLSRTLEQTMKGLQSMEKRIKQLHIGAAMDDAFDGLILEILVEAFQVISMLQDGTQIYMDMVQERCLALTSLNNHMLSPSLVPPFQLNRTLYNVEEILLREYVPFRFAMNTLDYFYSVPSTMYAADDSHLYVQIKIPLTILSAYYQVYEVHSVPLSVGKDDTQFTQVKDLPKYVAYSAQGDTYVFLDDKFLKSCEGTGIQRCYQRKMESSTLVPSCVLGLFIDDPDMIQQYCSADFILTPSLPEMAIDIGHGKFFISSMNTSAHWTISCNGRKPRALLSCRSCIIALDCRCNLKTPNSFISASLNNCPDAQSSSGLTK